MSTSPKLDRRWHGVQWPVLMTCVLLLIIMVTTAQPRLQADEIRPPEVKVPEQVTVLSAIEAYGFIRLNPEVNIVDLREPWEVTQRGYIEGASQMSYLHPTFREHFNMAVLRPNRPVLLYCALGERAKRASIVVVEQGYKDVHLIDGGLRAWLKAGLPVIK
jgi:rhodanese-related sulfurtransferase